MVKDARVKLEPQTNHAVLSFRSPNRANKASRLSSFTSHQRSINEGIQSEYQDKNQECIEKDFKKALRVAAKGKEERPEKHEGSIKLALKRASRGA